jgi:hypothetical protein
MGLQVSRAHARESGGLGGAAVVRAVGPAGRRSRRSGGRLGEVTSAAAVRGANGGARVPRRGAAALCRGSVPVARPAGRAGQCRARNAFWRAFAQGRAGTSGCHTGSCPHVIHLLKSIVGFAGGRAKKGPLGVRPTCRGHKPGVSQTEHLRIGGTRVGAPPRHLVHLQHALGPAQVPLGVGLLGCHVGAGA